MIVSFVPTHWPNSPVTVVPVACVMCAALRASHRKPDPEDPNQTTSQVRCPECCLASWRPT